MVVTLEVGEVEEFAAAAEQVAENINAEAKAEEAEDLLAKIEAAEVRCQASAAEVETAKEALKSAKALYDGDVETLRRLARVRKERHPLFDGASELPPDPEVWRNWPLAELALPARVYAALVEKADTLGKLTDLMNAHGQWWHREVKGFGEKAAETVADAFAAFWREHPEFASHTGEATPEEIDS